MSENSGADANVKSERGKRVYPITEAASCGIMYITSDVRFRGGGGIVLQGKNRFAK